MLSDFPANLPHQTKSSDFCVRPRTQTFPQTVSPGVFFFQISVLDNRFRLSRQTFPGLYVVVINLRALWIVVIFVGFMLLWSSWALCCCDLRGLWIGINQPINGHSLIDWPLINRLIIGSPSVCCRGCLARVFSSKIKSPIHRVIFSRYWLGAEGRKSTEPRA